jgi:putative membrane protein
MLPGRFHRRTIALLAIALLALATPSTAEAHPGLRIDPERWWIAWNWDAVILANLALLAWCYFRGLAVLHGRLPGKAWWLGAAMCGALLSLVIALVSPLDAMSEALSSAHMVQHMVLMTIAAPLLALASPSLIAPLGLPAAWRGTLVAWRRTRPWQLARRLSRSPLAMWWLHALVIWLWHVPALYHAALRNPLVHDLQHLSFFAAAFLFWRPMVDPLARPRLDRGIAVLMLFTTSLHATLLGAFMSFSPHAWYSDYAATTPAWGLTPLEDQQIAGFIMWIPACSVYAAAAAILFVLWLEGSSQRERRAAHGFIPHKNPVPPENAALTMEARGVL